MAFRPAQQKRSTTGVVKENVSDFVTVNVQGKNAKDRTVKKALKSKGEYEPKQKHVRATVLGTWRENGCGFFLYLLAQEAIDSDAISAFKGMVVTHQVLHEGPSGCIIDCYKRKELFASLLRNWERRFHEGYSDALKVYILFLIRKLELHHKHPDFNGAMSYEELLKKGHISRYDNPNEVIELVGLLLNQQDQMLQIRGHIFRGVHSQVLPAKLSCLVPLVVESYNIYTLTVHFLKQLCEMVESIDVINFLIEQFYGQYFDLRSCYDDISNVSYVTRLITVPLLPPDPPQFFVNRAPQSKPKEKKAKPVERQRKEQRPELSVRELEQTIQQAPPPKPVASSPMHDLSQLQYQPQPQQFQQQPQPQSMMMQQQNPSWQQFSNDPTPQPQVASFPQQQSQDAFDSFARLSMNQSRVEQEPQVGQFQQFTQPPQPQPTQVMPEPQPQPQQAQPQQEDPRDAKILDLKKRLLGLQKLFKIEKEKRLAAEGKVGQLEEQISKWKSAYDNLLKKNESLQSESGQLDDKVYELSNQVQQLETQLEEDRAKFLFHELGEIARAIQLGLVRLNSPTHQGRANASAPEVADAVSKLLQAIGILQSAKDAPGRVSALRAIGSAVEELLDVIKGVSNLTENPQTKQLLFDAGADVAKAVAALLAGFKREPENDSVLVEGRKGVESQIEKLDTALKALLSEGEGTDDVVDYDAFADEASRELMKAVQAIEDAAKRLEAARQSKKAQPVVDPLQAGISEAIMDAAMAIAQATANLVKNATVVQEENIKQGRAGNKSGTFYKRDCVWLEGLISAARAIAAATSNLVACANDAADGKVDEETLLAASQEVSAATAQLVCSARVRSDPNSEGQKRLEDASKAVSSATHHLVEAAKAARARKDAEEEEKLQVEFQTPMRKMLAVQEAKADILRLQNQLEKAQKRLTSIHSAEYQK
mmetsp:Transcript_43163/g.60545  ORF Transcript_43163/g.60545 Transcript_43163/m.60545 type:complete len:937 (-) Transcript_43163:186-2996(-)